MSQYVSMVPFKDVAGDGGVVLLEASVATITALERLEMPCSENEHDLTYDIPFVCPVMSCRSDPAFCCEMNLPRIK